MAENKDKKVLNVPNIRFKEFKEEWVEKRLEEICKTITDFVAAGSFASLKKNVRYFQEDNYAQLIRTIDLKNNFTNNDFVYIDKVAYDFLWRVQLTKSYIVLPNIGANIGEKYYIDPLNLPKERNVLGPNAILLNSECNTHFVYFRLSTSSYDNQIKKLVGASGQPKFNKTDLKKVNLFIPSVQEQNKIAKFLSLLDERIATQNKIIDKLESLIKGICNNYFLKLSHSQEMKSIRLGDILKERNEYCCKDGTFVHGTLSKDGLFPKTERWNRDFLVKEENKKYKITHLDDICYNPANLKFGVICRNIYGDLIFSPIYVTFEVSKKVNIGFIELYLTNRNFIEKIRKFEQGTVYERMSVSPENFLSYKIRIPSLSEQTFFYQKIQRLKNCSQNELEHLNLYKKLRQYLLRQMFI